MPKATDADKEKKAKNGDKTGLAGEPGESLLGILDPRGNGLLGNDRQSTGKAVPTESLFSDGEPALCPECNSKLDGKSPKCEKCGFELKTLEKKDDNTSRSDTVSTSFSSQVEQPSEIDHQKNKVKAKLDRMADKWAHLKYRQIEEENLKRKAQQLDIDFQKKEEELKGTLAKEYDDRLKKALAKAEAEHAVKVEEARQHFQVDYDSRIRKRLDEMKQELRKQEEDLKTSLETEFSEKIESAKRKLEEEASERQREAIEELEKQYRPKIKKRMDELEEDLDKREEDIRSKLEARYQKKFEELSARMEIEAKEREREKLNMLELEHKKKMKDKIGEIDSEIKKREADLLKEMETQYNKKFDERQKMLEGELKKREDALRRSLEEEYTKKSDALKKALEEEAQAVEKEGTRVALEYKKHMKEELVKLNADMRKKEDEFKKFVAALKKEKDGELLETYKIIEVQSDILMKILEKDEGTILRVLSELNLTIEDLKRIMGSK